MCHKFCCVFLYLCFINHNFSHPLILCSIPIGGVSALLNHVFSYARIPMISSLNSVLEGIQRGSSSERTAFSKLTKLRKTLSKLLSSGNSRKSQLDEHVRSSPSTDNGLQKPSSITYSATSSGGAHGLRNSSSAAPTLSKGFLEDQLSALRY
jgi:hypothetical protein